MSPLPPSSPCSECPFHFLATYCNLHLVDKWHSEQRWTHHSLGPFVHLHAIWSLVGPIFQSGPSLGHYSTFSKMGILFGLSPVGWSPVSRHGNNKSHGDLMGSIPHQWNWHNTLTEHIHITGNPASSCSIPCLSLTGAKPTLKSFIGGKVPFRAEMDPSFTGIILPIFDALSNDILVTSVAPLTMTQSKVVLGPLQRHSLDRVPSGGPCSL
jgi:hypothetical protein